MFRAKIENGAHLKAGSSPAYDFGTGDFTVAAMIVSRRGGVVLARASSRHALPAIGGFLLVVSPDGRVRFETVRGSHFHRVVSEPTEVLDGECHTLAAVRSGTKLSIFLDGVSIPVSEERDGNSSGPLNVSNGEPLFVGYTEYAFERPPAFTGEMMNVSVWNAALAPEQMLSAAFARINGREPKLQGYWTLDDTGRDYSVNANPLQPHGDVRFEPCLHCMWTALDAYAFCTISNMEAGRRPATALTLSRTIDVSPQTPFLSLSILAHGDDPKFPTGARVKFTDPQGVALDQNANTETLYVSTVDGQPWAAAVANPQAGRWRVEVTVPSTTEFHLFLQTFPTAELAPITIRALSPLYPGGPHDGALTERSAALDGFWNSAPKAGVGALTGLVLVAAATSTSGAAVFFVPFLIISLAVTVTLQIAAGVFALIELDRKTKATAQKFTAGAGFFIAPDELLILDADSDDTTKRICTARKGTVYSAVALSPFNKTHKKLIGPEMRRTEVASRLEGFATGYVCAAGHGEGYFIHKRSALTGYFNFQVLAVEGEARFSDKEAKGKIFHCYSCFVGEMGTAKAPGLGRELVSRGAAAFFGYRRPVAFPEKFEPYFIVPDAHIAYGLLEGKTCREVHVKAIEKYKEYVADFEEVGHYNEAAWLEWNQHGLVSPTTDPAYGKEDARLRLPAA